MNFKTSDAYQTLREKARWSHENRRSVFHIEAKDVALARLYAYAFRSQTIGAFHACRQAILSGEGDPGKKAGPCARAVQALQQLENLATLGVPSDFRALIFTFYHYDLWVAETLEALEAASAAASRPQRVPVTDRFLDNIQRITLSDGIVTADDRRLPHQASFVVPNLGITIVPLIYGDHHSWNCAHLTGTSIGVTTHRHRQGVEIHLGFSPIRGRTILGDHATELHEGYAMPIPAMTDHGFDNLSGHDHLVPFIFGSLALSGWGVFFDVEPRPKDSSMLREAPLESREMNQSVFLERAIDQAAGEARAGRKTLIPADATRSGSSGALDLGMAWVGPEGLSLTGDCFRIISVRRGMARIQVGPAEAELSEHDHVGIPPGLQARIEPRGSQSVVLLDTVLL